ncbi:UrcA family protein [Croceicoccus naphthovorans]|uniref:Uncharacterized protein n=1 Tax=Croceicoccus naphthovorans TaxID=1348774 RepID=A0A0G3XG39_9SPHN|nr:UrcA family protein [Croceicoccus naphthovorans]AKM09559.1 hypothetical protein AB433_05550 [Croceicoccus naphthovorans]MBB3989675.1 UrcA family protein [Croceicoccus naphthovorans]
MKTVSIIAAAAGLAIAAPAFAESVSVEYSDLNLSTEAGQKELDRRLNNAARQVCGMDQKLTGTRVPSRESRECYKNARAQFEQSIAAVTAKEARGG